MRSCFAGIGAISLLTCLSGCDLALAGPFMPPILPGVGFPLQGTVVDADTHLPIGGATVQSGFGSTITDAQGRFALYGGLGSHEVSVSRAGYTAVTDGDVDPNLGGELAFALEPLFGREESLPKRFLQITGPVTGLPPNQPAQVFFGGITAPINNGTYELEFGEEAPGRAVSSVLAWGTVNVPYNTPGQTFYYLNFYHSIKNLPLGDTVPQGRIDPFQIVPEGKPAPMVTTAVKYTNTIGFTSVTTDILLDFGVLGSVPVARQTASNQQISVPKVEGLKYDIIGTATDATGKQVSTVQLTTNDPAQATFPLLPVPKILSPTPGAKGVGQRPTFSWSAVTTAEVLYEVVLTEVGEGKKWVGRTTGSEITYPGFSQGDINGGALRSDRKYTWTLHVLDALGATQLPTAKAGPTPVKPYRVRQREAYAKENEFGL